MTLISDALAAIESDGYDPDEIEANGDTDNPLADYWADLALKLAEAVKAETVKVQVEYDAPDSFDRPQARVEATLDLPSWCEGDPAAGAALYLFGYARAVADLNITAFIDTEE